MAARHTFELRVAPKNVEELRGLFERELRNRRLFLVGHFEVGEREPCVLRVEHPSGSTFTIQGEVVYVKLDEPGAGIGLDLTTLTAARLHELEAFITTGPRAVAKAQEQSYARRITDIAPVAANPATDAALRAGDPAADAALGAGDPAADAALGAGDPAADAALGAGDPASDAAPGTDAALGIQSHPSESSGGATAAPAAEDASSAMVPTAGSVDAVPGAAHPATQSGAASRNLYETIRKLSLREREQMARQGSLPERVALERIYGSSVWEALLQNPQLTSPEVAHIAKNGTLPVPLVGTIVANAGWLASGEVRRALLGNPRAAGTHLDRVLKAMSRAELKQVAETSPYRSQVKAAAKKLLGP